MAKLEPYDYRKALRRILTLRARIERLQKEKTEVEDGLKQYMAWAGYDTLEVGSHKAIMRKVLLQQVDVNALREGMPDVARDYTVTREHTRLIVR